MIVELSRTSNRGGQADGIAYKENRLATSWCTCKSLDEVRTHRALTWFFRDGGQNHREEGGRTAVDFPREVWLADIPSLEWAFEKWGSIVVDSSEVVGIAMKVEIYDDYRE